MKSLTGQRGTCMNSKGINKAGEGGEAAFLGRWGQNEQGSEAGRSRAGSRPSRCEMEKCHELSRGLGVATGPRVLRTAYHAKTFGLCPKDNQELVKHFQGELRKFLRLMLNEASLAMCYPSY